MTDIFVIEVGKNYKNFEDLAYLKEEGYCLIKMGTFVWYIGSMLNDPYLASSVLAKTMGISPLNNNSIVQINKYEKIQDAGL